MSTSRSSTAALLPIFLVVLADVFGFTLVFPLLAIYAESLHATPLQAALLVSVFAACQLVSGPLLGAASDRVGRKPMLLISQVGTFLGFLLMARADSLWLLYLARVIDGATAGNLSIAQAYISDHTTPQQRVRSFALIGIAFGLGFFVGPFVTGSLVKYGLQAPIYAAAGLSMTSILCTLFLLPHRRPPQEPGPRSADEVPAGKRLSIFNWGAYARYFRRPVLSGLLLQFFFYALCFAMFTSGFAMFAERTFTWQGKPFSPREIGYLFAYTGFLGIVLQGGLIARLARRFAGLSQAHDVPFLVVVATISSFGNGVLRPALSSLISQASERHEQGVVLGLSQSLHSLAALLSPPLAGFLIEKRLLSLWALMAALGAAGGLLLARWGSAATRPSSQAIPSRDTR
jgi:MFS family permease